MANLDEILKMFSKTSEEKNYPDISFSELKRLGTTQLQAIINSNVKDKKQEFAKKSEVEVQRFRDNTEKKADSDKMIRRGSSQKFQDKDIKSDSINKEIFNINFTDEELVRGIIFSEILGRPKSKRRDKSFRGRRAR
jgi:hypothetical protein